MCTVVATDALTLFGTPSGQSVALADERRGDGQAVGEQLAEGRVHRLRRAEDVRDPDTVGEDVHGREARSLGACLALSGNQLTGEIPDLSDLTNLEALYLSGNQLTGEIPVSLGSITAMRDLSLSRNHLTGEIPDLSGLTNLTNLYLSQNDLTGQIPDWLGGLTRLQELGLNNNRLTGAIPGSLGTQPALRFARFANNALTGCVPHSLRSLLAAAEVDPGVPAQDIIAVDANRDGDTDDEGDVPGLNLPFCTLSALALSGVVFDPVFAPGTATYTAESTGASTMVTATRNELSDRLSVTQGATSYTEGDAIPLEAGSNLLTIEVTPTDSRLLKQTYTVDVFREGSVTSDREALIALYNGTAGSGWTAKEGWDTAQALSTWAGVTLDSDGRVEELDLDDNNLSGTLPASLSALTKLESLDLSGNQQLSRPLPLIHVRPLR